MSSLKDVEFRFLYFFENIDFFPPPSFPFIVVVNMSLNSGNSIRN